MGLLGNKNVDGTIETLVIHISGLEESFQEHQEVYMTWDENEREVLFHNKIYKVYNRIPKGDEIKRVEIISSIEISERGKGVGGRSIIGGLLIGALGTIVDGMSEINNNNAATAKPLHFDRKTTLTNECKQMNTKTQYGLETTSKNIITGKNITQKQANKIKAVINRDKPVKKANFEKTKTGTDQSRKIYMDINKINHINPFTVFVDNGTITESQAEKIIMKQIYLQHAKRLKSAL
ncbi:MAG TPA: hypothetical protein VIM42_06365 [Clostridium sp.]